MQTINGDGSTVFPVFFDRKTITLTFDYKEGNSVLTCTKETHTHTNGSCYKLVCSREESWSWWGHHHDNSCYDRTKAICGKEAHTHGASCYSSRNVQVVAKYGADISSAWPENKNGKMDWKVSDSSKANGQVGLRTMPSSNKTFYDYSSSYNSSQAFYYVERLDGSGYDLHHTDKSSGSGYSVTEEEMYPITGFTLNTEKSAKRGNSYDNAKFYHDRNSYNLLFFNNNQEVTGKTQSLKFEESLAGKNWNPDTPAGMEDYVFAGWYDNKYGAGVEFNFDQKMPAHDVVLYAKWVLPTHDVTIHETMEGINDTEVTQVGYGMTIAKPADPEPIEGKRFVGWATRAFDGEGYVFEVWNFGNEVRDDVELYPWFVSENASKVTYDFGENEGKLDVTLLPRDGKLYDESAAACVAGFNTADAQAALEKAGVENCVFLGWTDGTHSYQPGDRMPVKGDVTLTAMWGKSPKGTILVLHDNYPTADQVAPQDTTQTYKLRNNQQHTLDYVPTNIPKGYYFVGWSKAKNPTESDVDFKQGETVIVDNSGEGLAPKFENHLYAVYAKYLTVTYDPDGGAIDDSVEKKVVKENSAGQPLKKGDDTPLVNQPVRDGYTFGGWQDVDDNNIYTSNNFPKLSRDVEYRAVWKEQKFEVDKTVTNEGTGENGAFKVGDTINYKVEVKNTGEVAYEKPIYLKDSLVNLPPRA